MGSIGENTFCFFHLDKKGALAFFQLIRSAYPREYSVNDLAVVGLGRDVEASLSHDDSKAGCSQKSRFSSHVGTSQQHNLLVQRNVVGDNVQSLQTRMLSAFNIEAFLNKLRSNSLTMH